MKSKIIFYDRKMAIPVKTGIVTGYYGELMYIQFDKPYCLLNFTGKNRYMVEVSLQYIIDNLPEGMFLKCRRSAILNVCYCKELINTPPTAVMEDGVKIRLTKLNVWDLKYTAYPLRSSEKNCINLRHENR